MGSRPACALACVLGLLAAPGLASGALAQEVPSAPPGGEEAPLSEGGAPAELPIAGVQLNAGSSYGTGGAGHMRMNLATSRQNIKKALDNMAQALATI